MDLFTFLIIVYRVELSQRWQTGAPAGQLQQEPGDDPGTDVVSLGTCVQEPDREEWVTGEGQHGLHLRTQSGRLVEWPWFLDTREPGVSHLTTNEAAAHTGASTADGQSCVPRVRQ